MPPKEKRQEGAVPSGTSTPAPENQQMVDEDTRLRIRPDEKTPDPGESHAVKVPEEEWERHNRRKDTAQGLAQDESLVE